MQRFPRIRGAVWRSFQYVKCDQRFCCSVARTSEWCTTPTVRFVDEAIKRTPNQTGEPEPFCVLGLDISTTCTGFAVLDGYGTALEVGTVKRPKGASLLQMGAAITQRLRKAHSEHMFSRVAVEQFVKGFSGKHYQTRVLFQLAQVNGIVSYECMNITGCEPIEYMASQVRTRFGLRRPPRSEGSDGTSRNSKGTASNARTSIKHVVHTWVEAAFPDLQLPQTRNSTPRSDAFDMCDAVVVAAFHVCTLAAWSMLLDVAYPCGAPPAVRAVLLPDTYAPPVRLAAPDHALRQYIDAFACTRRVRASLDRDVLAETAQQCLRSIIRAKLQERGVEAPQMETVEDDAILDMPDANIAFRVAKMFVADVHEVMAHRIPGGAL